MSLRPKTSSLPSPIGSVGALVLVIGGVMGALWAVDALGLFPLIAGVFLALVVLGIVLWVARVLVSIVGLGPRACRMRWHWWQDFKIHERIGFGSRVSSYLAIHGERIHRCRTCGLYSPPEGAPVVVAYELGTLQKVGGGLFTSPKLEYAGGDQLPPTPPRSIPADEKPPPLPYPRVADQAPPSAAPTAPSHPHRRLEKWLVAGFVVVIVVAGVAFALEERQRKQEAARVAEAEVRSRAFVEALAKAEREWRDERADAESRFLSIPTKIKAGMDSRLVARLVVPILGKPDTDEKYGDEWHRAWDWDEWGRWNWKGEQPRAGHCFYHLRLVFTGRDGGTWKLSRIEEWKSGTNYGDCKFQKLYPPPPHKEYEGLDVTAPARRSGPSWDALPAELRR